MKTIKAKKEQVIESVVYVGSQSVCFREIYEQNGERLRVHIKSDAYVQQSFAIASILDGKEWRDIYTIPYSLMQTPPGMCYGAMKDDRNLALKAFSADIAKMKEKLAEILFKK